MHTVSLTHDINTDRPCNIPGSRLFVLHLICKLTGALQHRGQGGDGRIPVFVLFHSALSAPIHWLSSCCFRSLSLSHTHCHCTLSQQQWPPPTQESCAHSVTVLSAEEERKARSCGCHLHWITLSTCSPATVTGSGLVRSPWEGRPQTAVLISETKQYIDITERRVQQYT